MTITDDERAKATRAVLSPLTRPELDRLEAIIVEAQRKNSHGKCDLGALAQALIETRGRHQDFAMSQEREEWVGERAYGLTIHDPALRDFDAAWAYAAREWENNHQEASGGLR